MFSSSLKTNDLPVEDLL